MKKQYTFTTASSISELRSQRTDGSTNLLANTVTHVYIKLDISHKLENAENKHDATTYLRIVAHFAAMAELVAATFEGSVFEVQGSMIHVGLPASLRGGQTIQDFAAATDGVFDARLSDFDDLTGWRMAADTGTTIVVPGRGVHGDVSLVSLGNAANRPAKHLYRELDLPEERRELKKFHIGIRNRITGKFEHYPLKESRGQFSEHERVVASTRTADVKVSLRQWENRRLVTASAAPMGEPGSAGSPTAERPHASFGLVMRADLDGFTKRVSQCKDNPQGLLDLANEFVGIMDAATVFSDEHDQVLVQLPWAGDNYTAAVVYQTKDEYENDRDELPAEFPLDFDRDMKESVAAASVNGWAYGVKGGEVHGNASGNVFIGSVEFGDRRFLIGAGQGFGGSLQAFADIHPDVDEVIVSKEDVSLLHERYRKHFGPVKNKRRQTSSLFDGAPIADLTRARQDKATATFATSVTVAGGQKEDVPVRPHFNG